MAMAPTRLTIEAYTGTCPAIEPPFRPTEFRSGDRSEQEWRDGTEPRLAGRSRRPVLPVALEPLPAPSCSASLCCPTSVAAAIRLGAASQRSNLLLGGTGTALWCSA
jgi:hypothetical protein